MCGICGIVSKQTKTNIYAVKKMQNALLHRGPDGAGDFYDKHIALAMRRLSIIDLEGGAQPLYNEDKTIVLIANGEIYNFLELRAQLEDRDHTFRTKTDCETIVHLYEDYGPDCVHYLRGMFAFALWDSNRRRLLLARDRMGEKPLYLYDKDGEIIFASEMKVLLQSGLIPFELDAVAVNRYFHYQYVPEPFTIIKEVRKLNPAHILIVDVDPWQNRELCYWRMEDAPPIEEEPEKAIKSELERISDIVIRSDVPVGVSLSGGLDSSAIAALTSRKYPETMHAFCIGYPGSPQNDERFEARALADYLNMPFHDIELETSSIVNFFPELVYWRDDPIADISGHGYYAVMKLAREHSVPVILQGQAGDELFWGYPWVRQAVRESILKERFLNDGWKAFYSYLALGLPRSVSVKDLREWIGSLCGMRSVFEAFKRARTNSAEQLVFYDISLNFRSSRNTSDIYTNNFKEQIEGSNLCSLFTFRHPWPKIDILITRLISQTYLLENGITQGDRLSMASSVEMRLPFVDYRFVETVIGLRKVRQDFNLKPKTWLKLAMKDVLPDWVMNRPKRGFEPPVREWHGALFDNYGSLINEGYLVEAGILSPESSQKLSEGWFPKDVVVPLSFKALVLEVWCRRFSALT